MGMPWVKIYTEMLDDIKIANLEDEQKWRFVQLILLAGECDAGGSFVTGDSPMTHAQIAWRLRCDKSVIENDIEKMIEIGLMIDDGLLTIAKFRERQGPTQAEKRQKWAERQQNKRQKAIVTHESRVTKKRVTLKEEEEEEELSSADKSAQNQIYYDLQKYFLTLTGLPVPKQPTAKKEYAEFNTLWKTPGKKILEWVGYDIEKAKILVDDSVAELNRSKCTYANFKGIEKTAANQYSKRNGNGNGHA